MKENHFFCHIISTLQEAYKENLLGIILTGSRSRGGADIYSDYDLTVVLNNFNQKLVFEGLSNIETKIVGFRNITIAEFDASGWTQDKKNAFRYSEVIYDRNNSVTDVIERHCVWEGDEKKNLFMSHYFRLMSFCDVLNQQNDNKSWLEHMVIAEKRGNKLLLNSFLLSFYQHLLSLALLADNCFIPRRKVLFSPWIKNISPKAYEVLVVINKSNDILYSGNIKKELCDRYSELLTNILFIFEKKYGLQKDIYMSALKLLRTNKIIIEEK